MNYSAAIKQLSGSLLVSEHAQARLLALCNRAYCYQQLGLHRKALKVGVEDPVHGTRKSSQIGSCTRLTCGTGVQDYNEALTLDPSCVVAVVRKGKALWALQRKEVPVVQWQQCRSRAGT